MQKLACALSCVLACHQGQEEEQERSLSTTSPMFLKSPTTDTVLWYQRRLFASQQAAAAVPATGGVHDQSAGRGRPSAGSRQSAAENRRRRSPRILSWSCQAGVLGRESRRGAQGENDGGPVNSIASLNASN
jgi:hypothetical protein